VQIRDGGQRPDLAGHRDVPRRDRRPRRRHVDRAVGHFVGVESVVDIDSEVRRELVEIPVEIIQESKYARASAAVGCDATRSKPSRRPRSPRRHDWPESPLWAGVRTATSLACAVPSSAAWARPGLTMPRISTATHARNRRGTRPTI
jgi:hypothetical protein